MQATGANQPLYSSSLAALNNLPGFTHDSTDRLVSSVGVDASAGYTFVTAFRTGTLANWQGLLRLALAEATGTDGVCLYTDGFGGATVAAADATAWYRTLASGVFSSSTTYVVSLRCSGSPGSISLRVNGSPIALGAAVGTFSMPSSGSKFVLGGGWNNGRFVGSWRGLVGYVGALSDELTSELEHYFADPLGLVLP